MHESGPVPDPKPAIDGSFVCATLPASAPELLEQWARRRAGPASLAPSGVKRLILIRVDFSDLPGSPFTDLQGTNLVSELDTFYRNMSFDALGYAPVGGGSVITPVFRMPFTAALYPTLGVAKLRNDALLKAINAGYVLSDFDQDVICFGNVTGFNFTGQAYVGAQGAFLKNAFTHAGPLAHELAHNFGLNHANAWDTGGDSVLGTGKEIEYGDLSDTMSTATGYSRHFNARFKHYLGWLSDEQVVPLTTSGTYRLHAFDLTNAVAGARALTFARDARTNYWFDFRRLHTNSPVASASPGIRWADQTNRATLFLDTTPGTPFGVRDGFLRPGRTFSDFGAGLHVTTLGLAGTVPEAVDLDVRVGFFPENLPPTAALAPVTTEVPVGTTLEFTVTAADPDGDLLAYGWDFGDESLPPNAAVASYTFTTAGDRIVRCVVSDRRGGTATVQTVIRVGTVSTWRIAGGVTRAGQPLEGVQVVSAASRVARSASDGTYTFANLANGSYALRPVKEGYAFVPALTNVTISGSDLAGPDFLAYAHADLEDVALVAPGASWKYWDTGTDLGTTWRGSSYVDSSWPAGPAPLGYGEAGLGTTVSFGPNPNGKWVTTYFRKTFSVSNPTQYLALRLRLQKDDAAVVYFNGIEVVRSNLREGDFTFLTFALEDVTGDAESAFQTVFVPISLLKAGNNILAVEVHQFTVNTPDARFDLELTGLRIPLEQAPAVSVLPAGPLIRGVGESLTLSGTVTGVPTPTLRWQKDGADLPGETLADLTRNPLSLADTGSYQLIALNASGSATSAPVSLTVLVPPAITTPPLSLTRIVGEAATFNVAATGTEPLTFQWRFAGQPLPGAQAASFTRPTVSLGDAGTYDVIVSNAAGSLTSAPVSLTVLVPPAITTPPVSLTRVVGEAATFSVAASGTEPLTFQWRFAGQPLPGAQAASFTRPTVSLGDAGTYDVIIANAAGSLTSAPVSLTVLVPPAITTPPVSLTRVVGEAATFSVAASGTEPLTFQWRFAGQPLPGAQAASFTRPAVSLADAGTYDVIVANAAGSITSDPVTLTVQAPAESAELELTWNLLTDRGQLDLQGTPLARYRVESSETLGLWQLVDSVVCDADGLATLELGPLGSQPARFYRAVPE